MRRSNTTEKNGIDQYSGGVSARAIRDYALAEPGLSRLICLIGEHNHASIRVAEKIGMVFEKTSRDELGTFQLYSLEKRPN